MLLLNKTRMVTWMDLDVKYFSLLSILGFGLLIITPVDSQSSNSSYEIEMCVRSTEYIEEKDIHGTIFYDRFSPDIYSSATGEYGCVLTLKTCTDCKFVFSFPSDFQFEICPGYNDQTSQCNLGCSHLVMYEPSYPEATSRSFYRSVASGSFSTVSNSIIIKFCFIKKNFHGPNWRLNFKTSRKEESIVSSSGHFYSRGVVTSPFFPKKYATKDEIYTYTFKSRNYNDRIQLIFNDWNLSPNSEIKFQNSYIDHKIIKGNDYRPAIVSQSSYLTMIFITGRPAASQTDYMGFNLTYIFGFDRTIVKAPRTDCGGYYLLSSGGVLSLKMKMGYQVEKYDCIWVVKKQPTYDGLFIRLVDLYTYSRTPQFEIRDGATSVSPLLYTYPPDNKDYAKNGYYSANGSFYVRLKGYFSTDDVVKLTYASYKLSIKCYSSELFKCGDIRCIDNKFRCDGDPQCPTLKDEDVTECHSPSPDDSEYTISISIIIPLVVSVFVVIIVCLLAMFIHRCRKVSSQRCGNRPTSRNGGRRQRRRGRRSQIQMNLTIHEEDAPPSYDEVVRSAPIGYLNMGFSFNQPDTLPSLPSYAEAMRGSLSDSVILSASSLHNSRSSDSSRRSITADTDYPSQDVASDNSSQRSGLSELWDRRGSNSNVPRQSNSNIEHPDNFHKVSNIPSKRNQDQSLADMTYIYNSSSNSLNVVTDDSNQVTSSPAQKHSKHSKHNGKHKSHKNHDQPLLEVGNHTSVVTEGQPNRQDSATVIEASQNTSSVQNKRKRKKKVNSGSGESGGEQYHSNSSSSGERGREQYQSINSTSIETGQEQHPRNSRSSLERCREQYPGINGSSSERGREQYPSNNGSSVWRGREQYPSNNTSSVERGREQYPSNNGSSVAKGREQYPSNNTSSVERGREQYPNNNGSPSERCREQHPINNCSSLEKGREHHRGNNQSYGEKGREQHPRNNDSSLERSRERYQSNNDSHVERGRDQHQGNGRSSLERGREQHQGKNCSSVERDRGEYQSNNDTSGERGREQCDDRYKAVGVADSYSYCASDEPENRQVTSESRPPSREHLPGDSNSSVVLPAPESDPRSGDYLIQNGHLQELWGHRRANRQLVLALTNDTEHEDDIYV